MVFQRRLDYGFNGYKVPVVPRAPRSPGGRGPIRKKSENSQKHAFEILVSVAGEILQEETSVPTNTACGKDLCNVKNTIQQEQVDRGKKVPISQGSLASERFDYSETIYVAEKLVVVNSKNAGRSPSCEMNEKSSHAWQDGLEDATGLDGGSIGQASVESNVKAGLLYTADSMELTGKQNPLFAVEEPAIAVKDLRRLFPFKKRKFFDQWTAAISVEMERERSDLSKAYLGNAEELRLIGAEGVLSTVSLHCD
ncbi:hypothetical protein OIU84_011222 [Salix udensis]|uniref:Uncharacterized protein n=1 Tax=Salix udensis TaxID=889485 RepID=A0AAD6JPK3_9ROSI|nr:hypothetical protein OIU84_011222 [Salix udensis]